MKLYLKDSILEFDNGLYILKKGATIAKTKTPSFSGHSFEKRYDSVVANNIDKNWKLISDIKCTSLSQAASLVLGRVNNGRFEWKDKNGIRFENLDGIANQDQEEDDIIVVEEFLRDIEILDQLSPYSTTFNSFDVLNIIENEIRHSNVLGWLLNPNETHEISDEFIKRFIRDIYIENEGLEVYNHLNLSKIFLMDFDDVEVRREWKNIDILCISEVNKFILVIENKIWSMEEKSQLKRYTEIISKDFPNYQIMQVFLTPDNKEPTNDKWGTYSYNGILNVLKKIVSIVPKDDTKNFIKQYIDILRRNIVGNVELQQICRDIYKKHKRSLDLIFDYKPDHYSTVYELILEEIKKHDIIKLDHHSKSYIRFLLKDFDEIIPLLGSGWTSTGRILLFEIENTGENLNVFLRVGPCETGLRNSILEFFDEQDNKILLSVRTKDGNLKGKKWTSIYKKKIIGEKNYTELEYDDLKEKIKKFFNKFLETDAVLLSNIISEMELEN